MQRNTPNSTSVSERWQEAEDGPTGRKKIRIQRIKNERNRQVTFLKRKNGLLKKAMELSILCGCDISVVIFNINGKMFEYNSTDAEKIFTRYATYSGPAERRKPQSFFNLAAAKGNVNIPRNEPRLSQAALRAAEASHQRNVMQQSAPMPPPPVPLVDPCSNFVQPTSQDGSGRDKELFHKELFRPAVSQRVPLASGLPAAPHNPSGSIDPHPLPIPNSLQGFLSDSPTQRAKPEQESIDSLYPIPFGTYSTLPTPRYLDCAQTTPRGSSAENILLQNPLSSSAGNNLSPFSGSILHPEGDRGRHYLEEGIPSSVLTTSSPGSFEEPISQRVPKPVPSVPIPDNVESGPSTGSSANGVITGDGLRGRLGPDKFDPIFGAGSQMNWGGWTPVGSSLGASGETQNVPPLPQSRPFAEEVNKHDAGNARGPGCLLSEAFRSSPDLTTPSGANGPRSAPPSPTTCGFLPAMSKKSAQRSLSPSQECSENAKGDCIDITQTHVA